LYRNGSNEMPNLYARLPPRVAAHVGMHKTAIRDAAPAVTIHATGDLEG
jgi:hypothetical protein